MKSRNGGADYERNQIPRLSGQWGLENVTYNEVHGEIPAARFYTREDEEEKIISGFIKRVMDEGLDPADVVILTAKTIESSWINLGKKYAE